MDPVNETNTVKAPKQSLSFGPIAEKTILGSTISTFFGLALFNGLNLSMRCLGLNTGFSMGKLLFAATIFFILQAVIIMIFKIFLIFSPPLFDIIFTKLFQHGLGPVAEKAGYLPPVFQKGIHDATASNKKTLSPYLCNKQIGPSKDESPKK